MAIQLILPYRVGTQKIMHSLNKEKIHIIFILETKIHM